MSYLAEYDELTIQDVVRLNSHELTALQLLTARNYIREQEARHRAEIEALRDQLSYARRVGFRVLAAEAKGRKTVRVADMVTDLPAAGGGEP